MNVHEIKCWPEQFTALASGRKGFEYRKNDRGYQVGDALAIREWNPADHDYTGQSLTCSVIYILSEGFGLPKGYAVLGLSSITPAPADLSRGDVAAIREALSDPTIASNPDFTSAIEIALAELEQLRAGIKRLSDEEELCAETTGDGPYSMVYLAAKLAELEAANKRLRKQLSSCTWYWPEDDTSSEACADGPWQIVENCDVKEGEVFGYSRGGVVETRYYGYLDAAEDADSDDQFEADEPTREAAEAKIAAELSRRAALKSEGSADA